MGILLTWKNNEGLEVILNSANFPIDEELNFDVEFSDPSVRKLQRPGEWPTFAYPGSCRVTCDGHILGTSAANFWANRKAFLNALTPPNQELTSRRHGTLTIDDDDEVEPVYQYCRIINRVANLGSLSPERCAYLVTFKAFVPYFTGLASGRDYVIG
jgi:hypothetical protein